MNEFVPVGSESLVEVRRWLRAVGAITDAVNSTQSLSTTLDLVASSARALLGFDFCAVLLPDRLGQNLVITGWSGLSADYVARVNADRPVRLTVDDAAQAPSSKAFNSGRPVAIRDIASEPEFTPWGGVAREQGYRAMVSIPLVAGGAVVGTLNGYHAEVHELTEHELERLTLLANHAAIALTSARLVDQLQTLNDSLRSQRDLLAKSEQIHQQLLDAALRGGGMGGIVAVLADLVSRPVRVDDTQGAVLAQAGAETELPAGRLLGDPTDDDPTNPVVVRDNDRTFVGWPVQLGTEMVARIWLPGTLTDLTPIDRRAVEHASIVMSLEIVRLRTGIEVEHRLRGELLADILSGTADNAGLRERAERLGHNLALPHAAIVGRLESSVPGRQASGYQRAMNAVGDLASRHQPRPLVAMHRGLIVVLWPIANDVPGPVIQQRIKRIADEVRRTLISIPGVATALVAVSGVEQHSYPQAYRMARGALDIAERSGRSNATVTLDDLGVSGLLLQLDDPGQLLDFADRTLAEVRQHDLRRGTQLLRTLQAYLDNRQSRSATARALHLHPNTVTQRLQRIETLTELDLSQPEAIVQVRAAVTMLGIAGRDDVTGAQP